MATKAELEDELAALRKELEHARAETPTETDSTDPAETHASTLKKVLADHGVEADTIEGLAESLMDELKVLQKEKPLTLALAAFALGLVVGRASK